MLFSLPLSVLDIVRQKVRVSIGGSGNLFSNESFHDLHS